MAASSAENLYQFVRSSMEDWYVAESQRGNATSTVASKQLPAEPLPSAVHEIQVFDHYETSPVFRTITVEGAR